jgi:hypothetical protein
MRAYFFTNYYMSPIQKGIQALHCVADMFVYQPCQMLEDWAGQHKTVVLLNGGNSADLIEINQQLKDAEVTYPFSMFSEDEQSLNGAVTCVGIILPEKVYTIAGLMRKEPGAVASIINELGATREDVIIAEIISSYPLAN